MSFVPSYLRGILWMLGAQASFLMMSIGGRELSDTMNTFQIVLLRALTGLLILFCIMAVSRTKFPRTSRLSMHVFRNIFHYSAQTGWFFAVSLLPLATVFAIEFTTPIWGALLAIIFLGEQLNKGRVVAIIVGFLGALIILRPTGGVIDIGSLAALWAAFGFASVYIITKALGKSEEPFAIIFWMLVIQIIVGFIPGYIFWVPVTLSDLIWIFVVGAGSVTAHYCVAKAVSAGDYMTIAPLDFVRLPAAALIGVLIYNEMIEFAVLVGAIIIFAANYYNIRLEKTLNP